MAWLTEGNPEVRESKVREATSATLHIYTRDAELSSEGSKRLCGDNSCALHANDAAESVQVRLLSFLRACQSPTNVTREHRAKFQLQVLWSGSIGTPCELVALHCILCHISSALPVQLFVVAHILDIAAPSEGPLAEGITESFYARPFDVNR